MTRTPRAFTLIELLVVVAILGLIMAIILVSLQSAQERARDSKRTSDAAQVMRALELYRAEVGTYPAHGGTQHGGCTSGNCLSVLTDELVPTYLPVMPIDPKQGNTPNGYRYCAAEAPHQGYQIIMRLEENTSYCTVRGPSPITGAGRECWTNNSIPDFPYCD